MADGRPTLEAEPRSEQGSRSSRRLRRTGFVPGIVYGEGSANVPFKVHQHALRAALVSSSAVIDLKVGSDTTIPVIVKDQQLHPVRSDVMHIDLLEVNLKEKIHSSVRVELTGADDAPGVVEGGVMSQEANELNIEALPTDIPDVITVDVSKLEAAGTLHLSEIPVPSGVTFLDDPETIIATVTVPTDVPEEPEIEEETERVGDEGAGEVPADEVPEDAGPTSGDSPGESGGSPSDS
jgi:large subunit ribosomal protein L25